MEAVVFVLAAIFLLAKLKDELPKAWRFVTAAASVPKVLEQIIHEFAPNSGGSIRDSLDRVEADMAFVKQHGVSGVREAHDRIQLVEQRVTVNEGRIDSLETRLF